MFDFFRKSKKISVQAGEQHSLPLSPIEGNDLSVATIAQHLRNETPLIAVYNPLNSTETSLVMLLGVERNGLTPSITMYKKIHDLLCVYQAFQFDEQPQLYFMLYKVLNFRNSNLIEIYNSELKYASELYYDDQGFADAQLYFAHNFKCEEAYCYFRNNTTAREFFVGRERLITPPHA